MKRIILVSIISCFMVSMASAQSVNMRVARRQQQTPQRFGTSPAQREMKLDQEFKQRMRSIATWNELEAATSAMDDAQRRVNNLASSRQAKIEKFNKKLEKITDPIQRASELKKFEEKLQKEMLDAQKRFENAQARYYRALERY